MQVRMKITTLKEGDTQKELLPPSSASHFSCAWRFNVLFFNLVVQLFLKKMLHYL